MFMKTNSTEANLSLSAALMTIVLSIKRIYKNHIMSYEWTF